MNSTRYICAMSLLLACSCTSRVGQECGGSGNTPCGIGEYCLFEQGSCGTDGQAGICEAIPQFCTLELSPVCGCDGVTYGNACEAAQAGALIASEGECGSQPQVCGGIAGIGCPDGQYCQLETGNCCCDFMGICADSPLGCPDVDDPVCGCDGETYGNECEAAAVGVSLDHDGACEQAACCAAAEQPGVGGNPTCVEGASCCSDGEWKCNSGDGSSTCEQAGEVCPSDEAKGAAAETLADAPRVAPRT